LAGAAAALLLAAPLAARQDPPPKESSKPEGTPAEQVKAIQKEYEQVQEEWVKAFRAAKTPEERQKVKFPEPEQYAARMLAVAEKHPDDSAAVDALAWTLGGNLAYTPSATKAMRILKEKHAADPKVGKMGGMLAYVRSKEAEDLLRAVLEKADGDAAKAAACFNLAQHLHNKGNGKEAEALYEKVTTEYAASANKDIAQRARGALFEIRNLAIGKVAPEIEGQDADGKPMKLSDYRGKVVVLDFWGHW